MTVPRSSRPAYLFVVPWDLSHVGGVNQVVLNLAREMEREGTFAPCVWVTDWQYARPNWIVQQGLNVMRWRVRPLPDDTANLKERIAYRLWLQAFRPALRAFCGAHRVAVVNAHYAGPTMLALGQALAMPTPSVAMIASFHGADVGLIERSRSGVPAWQQLFARGGSAVTCSADLAERVRMLFGASTPVHVVHNGLDVEPFVARFTAAAPVGRTSYLLSVARFERKKGLDLLVEAFAHVARVHPEIDLVLVGANGDELVPLRGRVDALGLGARVEFHVDVPHERIAGHFAGARLFVLPSRDEPFGIVLLEAGACGVPVVAAATGGIPEIVVDGVSGRLFRRDDAAALTSCLLQALDDGDGSLRMAAALRERVATQFSWDAALRKYAVLASATRR